MKKAEHKNQRLSSAAIVLGIIFFLLLIFFFWNQAVSAVEIGGKASFISNLIYQDSSLDSNFRTELELEMLLPYDAAVDLQNRAVIVVDGAEAEIWFKRLYLRKDLGPFTAKFGRQPVSWAFGSLLNPADYTLGAEALEEESRAKFVDGIELYYPIGWGSGLTFVVSDTDADNNKWALRGRSNVRGYDLTANYVKDPSDGEGGDLDRFALTAKGDLGPLGVYSSLAKWQNEKIDYNIYQIGSDYSYSMLDGRRIRLQGEYLRISGIKDEIRNFSFFDPISESENDFLSSNGAAGKVELFNSSIAFEPDEFSSIGIITVSYLGDGSTLIIPNYSYLFSSDLLLELRGIIPFGSEDELLAEGGKSLELTLSYTF